MNARSLQLNVLLACGHGLRPADANGLSDPFCVATVGTIPCGIDNNNKNNNSNSGSSSTGETTVSTSHREGPHAPDSSSSSTTNSARSSHAHSGHSGYSNAKKTKVHKRTLDPIWNCQLTFLVNSDNPAATGEALTVCVYDWDRCRSHMGGYKGITKLLTGVAGGGGSGGDRGEGRGGGGRGHGHGHRHEYDFLGAFRVPLGELELDRVLDAHFDLCAPPSYSDFAPDAGANGGKNTTQDSSQNRGIPRLLPGSAFIPEVTGNVHAQLLLSRGDTAKPRLVPSSESATKGVLFVRVVEGRNLAAKDVTGTSDPYVRVRMVDSSDLESGASGGAATSASSASSSASSSGGGAAKAVNKLLQQAHGKSPAAGGGVTHMTRTPSFRTATIKKDLNPHWQGEEFYLAVEEDRKGQPVQALEAIVEDWNRVGHSDAMGHTIVRLDDNMLRGAITRGWFPLVPTGKETVSGDIFLSLQYTSALMAQRQGRIAKERYSELVRILTDPDCVVAAALCRVCDSVDVARALVAMFDQEARITSLLNLFAYREVKATTQEDTLFRGNSACTKVFVEYMKLAGGAWLQQTLQPLVERVLSDPNVDEFEVDPARVPDPGARLHHQQLLEETCTDFFEGILHSASSCPVALRLVLSNLRRLVTAIFPRSRLRVVGAFVFLRFLVPAIVAPEGFKIVRDAISPTQRRALTLISKVVQNVANDVQTAKEPYLAPFLPMVQRFGPRLELFYEQLSTVAFGAVAQPCLDHADEGGTQDVDEARIREMSTVVRFLTVDLDRMEERLLEDPRLKADPGRVPAARARLEALRRILGLAKNIGSVTY